MKYIVSSETPQLKPLTGPSSLEGGLFSNTNFLFRAGFLGSGFWVLGPGSPIFQKIPGRSRSGVFSITLLHEIVDFWPNLGGGPFGGYFSAKT